LVLFAEGLSVLTRYCSLKLNGSLVLFLFLIAGLSVCLGLAPTEDVR